MNKIHHLYIIGNGFDKHHGIPSGYDDYEKWLEMYHLPILNDIIEKFGFWVDEKSEGCVNKNIFWNDFEKNLSMSLALYAQRQINKPVKQNNLRGKNTTLTKKTKGTLNGHEWIDLGLHNGTKWATCNIGADDLGSRRLFQLGRNFY